MAPKSRRMHAGAMRLQADLIARGRWQTEGGAKFPAFENRESWGSLGHDFIFPENRELTAAFRT